jgi:hypothetical protein
LINSPNEQKDSVDHQSSEHEVCVSINVGPFLHQSLLVERSVTTLLLNNWGWLPDWSVGKIADKELGAEDDIER